MRSWIALLVVSCNSSPSPSPHTTDIAPTLRFADRSDAEINQLFCSAAGNDVIWADNMVRRFGSPEDPCPGVQGNAPVGGCTTPAGTAITGSVMSNESYSSIQFDALTLTNPAFVETWDGTYDGGVVNGNNSDLTVGHAGITVHTDLGFTCMESPMDTDECDICEFKCGAEGSGIELVGAGGALIQGTWGVIHMSEFWVSGGDLWLVGDDTVKLAGMTWSLGSRSGNISCPLSHAQI